MATKLKPEGGDGALLGSRRVYDTTKSGGECETNKISNTLTNKITGGAEAGKGIEAKLSEESNLSEAQLREPSRQTELRVALDQASRDIKRFSMELCSNRWFTEKVRSDLNSNSFKKCTIYK